MKRYTIYNKKGEILRVGQCPNDMFNLQVHPERGEQIIEGLANDRTQKVVDGKIANKTLEEI